MTESASPMSKQKVARILHLGALERWEVLMQLHNGLVVLCVLMILGGCSPWNTPRRADALLTSGWAGPAPTAQDVKTGPLYCYSTLGSIDCYRYKQPGLEHLCVGSIQQSPENPVDLIDDLEE